MSSGTPLKRKLSANFGNHSGSFDENSIPSSMVFLGENVFVSASSFRSKTAVHIRRYKKFGTKFYPSPEGVTMTPNQFIYLTSRPDILDKTLSGYLTDFTFFFTPDPVYTPPAREAFIVHTDNIFGIRDRDAMQDDDKELVVEFGAESVELRRVLTCRSGRIYTRKVGLTNEQWTELFAMRESMMTPLIDLKYAGVSFQEHYECITDCSSPVTGPSLAETTHQQQGLVYMLENAVFQDIAEKKKGLFNPRATIGLEVNRNRLSDFNASVHELCFSSIVTNFVNAVRKHPNPLMFEEEFKELSLESFISADFLQSINICDIIQKARDEFIM